MTNGGKQNTNGMKTIRILLVFSLLVATPAMSQEVKQLDSLHRVEEKDKPIKDVNKFNYTKETNLTPKSYITLLATDLTQEVTGPFHATGKTWIKVGEFAVVEAGLYFFADKGVQRTATTFMAENPGLKNTSQYITDFGASYEVYTLAAFGLYGIIFKSNKVKTTTLLATQSYLAAGAMSYAVKFLSGRQRPNAGGPDPDNMIWRGPSAHSTESSFPSGHTTAAFSAATVFAQEYKDQTLIPVIAYTAATLVGISRISQNAHWLTDVFAGAALGYVTGKQVSNNYHRYMKLQAGKVKTAWFFNLQYNNGVIMPGAVCKF
jgi:membrane-associated phospholipid phosphatase